MSEDVEAEALEVSESGGTMRRLTAPLAPGVTPDLAGLESLRLRRYDGRVRPAGGAPYLAPGDLVTWQYALGVDPFRVVADDEHGLVAWLPEGSDRLAAVPRDGKGLRERTLDERAALAVTGGYDHVLRTWTGPGILRVAPTGRPWSIWYFFDDAGRFEGHYVNLELTHERAVDAPVVLTRDLTLDLWLDPDGTTWVKDEDELDAFTRAGRFSVEQAETIRALADLAVAEMIGPRAWPLDAGFETYRPPPGWDQPLRMTESGDVAPS